MHRGDSAASRMTEGMHFMQCRPRKDMGLGDPFSAVHDALVREVVPALRRV